MGRLCRAEREADCQRRTVFPRDVKNIAILYQWCFSGYIAVRNCVKCIEIECDGSLMVKIVAFQAIDPGSIPGHRSIFFSRVQVSTSVATVCAATVNM